jgi:hypothetical protein
VGHTRARSQSRVAADLPLLTSSDQTSVHCRNWSRVREGKITGGSSGVPFPWRSGSASGSRDLAWLASRCCCGSGRHGARIAAVRFPRCRRSLMITKRQSVSSEPDHWMMPGRSVPSAITPGRHTLGDESGEIWKHFGVTHQSSFVLLDASGTKCSRPAMAEVTSWTSMWLTSCDDRG